ncbi:CBS domain-containing protein [Halalkalibaculum sp. DA3122]|uniref:CBS domain-containing protein n=1 Tax=unclassified Halalkalibaculum TaxID=2964617 RepID=UPI0037545DD2
MMLVSNILKSKGNTVYHIDPESTVYQAIKLMSEKRIGALVVLDERGALCGIISERDYRDKVILKGRRSKTTPVKDIMTSEVYWVTPDTPIKKCMALMTEKKFRHLPILEQQNGEVIGVISIGDLVKQIISEQKVEINHLKNYIVGSYPG